MHLSGSQFDHFAVTIIKEYSLPALSCHVMWNMRGDLHIPIRKWLSSSAIFATFRPTTSASHQQHALSLLIATFSALFRYSLPLLLDFDDRFNKDLPGSDEELLGMAQKVRLSLLWFRKSRYIKTP